MTTTRTEGTNELVPGFLPTQWVEVPVSLELSREDGPWRVVLRDVAPRVRPGVTEEEHGEDTVTRRASNREGRQMTQANGQAALTAEQIRGRVRDPPGWVGRVPGLVEARYLAEENPSAYERPAYFRFEESGATVDVVATVSNPGPALPEEQREKLCGFSLGAHGNLPAVAVPEGTTRVKVLGVTLNCRTANSPPEVTLGDTIALEEWPEPLRTGSRWPGGVVAIFAARTL